MKLTQHLKLTFTSSTRPLILDFQQNFLEISPSTSSSRALLCFRGPHASNFSVSSSSLNPTGIFRSLNASQRSFSIFFPSSLTSLIISSSLIPICPRYPLQHWSLFPPSNFSVLSSTPDRTLDGKMYTIVHKSADPWMHLVNPSLFFLVGCISMVFLHPVPTAPQYSPSSSIFSSPLIQLSLRYWLQHTASNAHQMLTSKSCLKTLVNVFSFKFLLAATAAQWGILQTWNIFILAWPIGASHLSFPILSNSSINMVFSDFPDTNLSKISVATLIIL